MHFWKKLIFLYKKLKIRSNFFLSILGSNQYLTWIAMESFLITYTPIKYQAHKQYGVADG